MSKQPYNVVAATNDKEFDVKLKWELAHRPHGDMAQSYRDVNGSTSADQRPPHRRAHVRRKHRADCPKHLMNEILRSGGVPAPLTPAPSRAGAAAAPFGSSATAGSLSRQEHFDELPRLRVPHTIGRGLGEFLAGVANPHYDKLYRQRRPNREHPNFAELNRAFDQEVEEKHQTFVASQVEVPAPAWLVNDKLLMDNPPDRTHYRKKYEMKAHMEAVRMMGKALLREFSGAAFK